ncbi:MAG: penicillin-binding protein [Clostridiales bacterium]|nr:penicillin-binding protein [Clostridiales bacterium]
MNKSTKRSYVIYMLIIAFLVGVGILIFNFIVHGNEWAASKANKHVYDGGALTCGGSIYDRDGVCLAKTEKGKRVFNSSSTLRKATLHIVGDPEGCIPTGTHTVYSEQLAGYDLVDGVYNLKKYGKGNDIHLTVSAKASRAAYEALEGFNGAVGVYNYKTGEVLCDVSKPTYDIANKPSDLLTNEKKYNGVYLNRFFSGLYVPGSVFKVVTAACAIDNIPDIYSRNFECKGKVSLNGGTVICNSVHGKVSFKEALNQSCNCAFAQLAVELGEEKLTATANAFGFNQSLKASKINLGKSRFNVTGVQDYELGWAGIGQYTTLVSPCQIIIDMGAIANGGVAAEPQTIKKIVSPAGYIMSEMRPKDSTISISPSTADKLKVLLRSNVTDKYGDSRFPGLKMCGKTGTAEVDDGKPHSWFAGFSLREDMPFAVVVIAENAGSGSGVAMEAANKVLQALAG